MTREIPLIGAGVALVDDEDYPALVVHRWYGGSGDKYARRKTINAVGTPTSSFMHRDIMQPERGIWVDHINGNTLDNRRCNLRLVNGHQNAANSIKRNMELTSKYKGVCWNKNRRKWRATIAPHRKQIDLGYFDNEIDAARTYDKAALKHFGEYAKINTYEAIE